LSRNLLRQQILIVPTVVLVICTAGAFAAGACADEGSAWREAVAPILQQHCYRCHGPLKQESRVRLDTLSGDLLNDRAAAEMWHEVLNVLNTAEMPPADEPQLTAAELETLTTQIRRQLQAADEANRATAGRVVMRRLNRVEYQNTMQDLIGIDMDYAGDLPPDAISSDGFTNNGQSLQMSAIQLEYYLANARRALDRAIVSGEAPRVTRQEWTESNLDDWLGRAVRTNRLQRSQEFLATMKEDYPEVGEFLIRVTVAAEIQAGQGFPLLEVSLGYRPDTEILMREFELIELTTTEEQTFEFRGRLEEFPLPVRGQGKYPGLVVRVRNRFDDLSERPAEQKVNDKRTYPDEPALATIVIRRVEFSGPIFDQWPPATHRRILFESPLRESDEAAYSEEVLRRFMSRAYRRPVRPEELQSVMEFLTAVRPEFPTHEAAMIEALSLVLIRPEFLYLVEPAGDEKRPIDNWELASRMSYFLWSTMPDQELLDRAADGTLSDRRVRSEQVQRMLLHPYSSRFVEQFAEQWLKLKNMDSVAVQRELYPDFDERLRADMRGETIAYLRHLIDGNHSVDKLLKSEFTMLNGRLARHYGIEGVTGETFRRVELAEQHHRGGLLGQAGFLLANSTGADSHAIRRAVWIRDRLLNDPPAPPPPDVPSLEESTPNFHELPVRQQLEVHRQKPACASCHRNLDAWGIALENYDATGRWRDEVRRIRDGKIVSVPVESTGELPGGIVLTGAAALREHLVAAHQHQAARSLVTRLLAYALGREVERGDEAAIEELAGQLAKKQLGIRDLVNELVFSDPFNTK
jgi:mono/diheme cytochrome c family protein